MFTVVAVWLWSGWFDECFDCRREFFVFVSMIDELIVDNGRCMRCEDKTTPCFCFPPSLLCYVTRIYNTQQATPFLRMNNEMNGVLSTTTMRFQWRRRRSDSIDFQQRRELRTPLTNASMSNASFLMTAPHYTSPERWMLLLLLVKSSPAWMFDPWYYYYDDCEYVQPFCLYSMIRSIYYVTVLTRQEDDDPTYTHSTLPRESLLQPILLHASQK
jgi:hypothetical protein